MPDSFQDFYINTFGTSAAEDTLTFCKRELFHAVWALIFNLAFMHAYEFGFAVLCADGIMRLLFPRIFLYTADYPEKLVPVNFYCYFT